MQISSQNNNYQKKFEEKFESSSKIQTPLKMKINSVLQNPNLLQMDIEDNKFYN